MNARWVFYKTIFQSEMKVKFSVGNDVLFVPAFWDNSLLLLRPIMKILLGFVASQKQKIKAGYSSGHGRELWKERSCRNFIQVTTRLFLLVGWFGWLCGCCFFFFFLKQVQNLQGYPRFLKAEKKGITSY